MPDDTVIVLQGADERPAGPTALIPWNTIERMVALRDEALRKYEIAHDALTAAQTAIGDARAAGAAASMRVNSYNFHTHGDRRERNFLCNLDVAEREAFLAAARRLTDTGVWAQIVELTELETVMDKEEKDKLRAALVEDPPEVTVENVYATLERFVAEADTIWKRGLANCFSRLDRRFRSHTGWKIGSRVIVDRAFDDWGHWSFSSNHKDTVLDVERVFFLLDGRTQPPHYAGIIAQIDDVRSRGPRLSAFQSVIETEYFRVRVYKNGNLHLWFRRDDLVRKANLLLAEYYGEVLADDGDQGDEGGLSRAKTAPARFFGHFPTPPAVAAEVMRAAAFYRGRDEAGPLRVLEPSAGEGNLALPAVEQGGVVDCVEIQPHLAAALEASGRYRRVIAADFLALPPSPVYDRIIMNPPFDRERDIDHVMHAMRFLKPDGLLVAVMSAGTEWRSTKKARGFRDHMATRKASWRDLPQGSFSEVGTNVNTVILRVWNDGRQASYW